MTRANAWTLAAYAAVVALTAVWMLFLRGGMQEAGQHRARCMEAKQNVEREFYVQAIFACTALIDAGRGTPDELAELHFKRGVHHMGAHNYGQAIEDFTDAIKYHPDFEAAYTNRAISHAELGQVPQALADFAQSLKRKPDDVYALTVRGLLYDQAKQPEKAEADFALVEKIAPRDIQSLTLLGQHRARQGRCEQAEKLYRRALAIDSRYANGWFRLGQCQAKSGRDRDAIASFDKALALGRNDGTLYERAQAHARLEHYDRAVADVSTLLSLGGADPYLLNERCWFRVSWGHELAGALEDCDAAVAASPDNWHFRDSRGLAHLRLGNWREAVADYDAALLKQPRMETALYGRGIARKRLGDAAGGADIAAALDIMPGVARDFEKMGLRP